MLAQSPGRISPETKLDLAVAPARFISRALRLWQPQAAFGHIQNQATGYLFPMGPFFALGHLANAPMWLVQRLWMAAILTMAFWGVVRVADALEIGRPSTRVAAGLSYALSIPMLTLLAYTSGGQVAVALAPWVLLPLIHGSRGGSPRRAAARSGLFIAGIGAVNATSTLGALPLSLVFLLTRSRGARRRQLLGWWLLAVLLATLWWLIPLLLQARYGLDFVPFTETARVTTATTSAHEVIRGSGYWLSYLFTAGPWLRAGWLLVRNPAVVVATTAVAAAGLAGLGHRRMRERTFLVVAAVLGVSLIVVGYGGELGSPVAGMVGHLLDGPLAPIRNLHKMEPLVRLPLALGLAHFLDVALDRLPANSAPRSTVAFFTAAALALSAIPALAGQLIPAGSFKAIPGYWESAARWVDGHEGRSRTLIVPGSAFGEYTWGRPLDEPFQPLATGEWAVRDLIPLGSTGTTRLLDQIDDVVRRGQADPQLALLLADMGVRYVLVRNDLDLRRAGVPSPALLRETFKASPGFTSVASFGPSKRRTLPTDRLTTNLGPRGGVAMQAIDIYQVRGASGPVTLGAASSIVRMAGGPEAKTGLLDAAAAAPPVPTVIAGDVGTDRLPPPAIELATDLFRKRDVDFGSLYDNYSYTLTTREQAPGFDRPPKDRLVVDPGQPEATITMTGASQLTASSYGAPIARLPERQPFAAFDGNPATGWVAGNPKTSAGEWLELRTASAIPVSAITVSVLRDDLRRPVTTQILITTDAGKVTRKLAVSAKPQTIQLNVRRTRRVRITLSRVARFGQSTAGAGLAEVSIPGLKIRRQLALPNSANDSGPEGISVTRAHADPFATTRQDEEQRLDRAFNLSTAQTFDVTATATVRRGSSAGGALGLPDVGVNGSSTWHDLPAFRPSAAFDGDPLSTWIAEPNDSQPVLDLTFPSTRTLTAVRVVPAGGPTQRPTSLRIMGAGQSRDVELDSSGRASFSPLQTAHATVLVKGTSSTDVPFAALAPLVAPAVGIAELSFPGVAPLAKPVTSAQVIGRPCGKGPALRVDGVILPTELRASVADALKMGPAVVRACRQLVLGSGPHTIETDATDAWAINSLLLDPQRLTPPTPKLASPRILSWQAEHRRVAVKAGVPAVLAVAENFNSGWAATLKGKRLTPVRLDGWRQGFIVPGGSQGAVDLRFTPGRLYRIGLALGALALLMLVVAALGRRRSDNEIEALSPGVASSLTILALAAFVGLVSGGILVLVAGVLLVLPQRRRLVPLLAGPAFLSSGVVVAAQAGRFPASGSGAFGPAAQALSVTAIVALAITLFDHGSPSPAAEAPGPATPQQ
jgi:arabinofuranan 3-O-arabinosyltransferase